MTGQEIIDYIQRNHAEGMKIEIQCNDELLEIADISVMDEFIRIYTDFDY